MDEYGPDDITIRDFESEDLDACLMLFDSNVPQYFSVDERAAFEAFLESLSGPYTVLLEGGSRVVGCGGWALGKDGVSADLCWGMVERECHGQGLGRALTRHRIEQIRADGRARRIRLDTSQHTEAFYRRFGFETLEVVRDGYAAGLHRCEMSLSLSDGDSAPPSTAGPVRSPTASRRCDGPAPE